MSIKILDCTLRDGGYCNKWKFGRNNISKIIKGLIDANIDIIECGFLTNKGVYTKDETKFNSVDDISKVIPKNKKNKLFVAMINYGEYDVSNIPDSKDCNVDGFRIAFHKKNMIDALSFCKKIKDKGYKVFIQAMLSLNYSEDEFIDLINRVNEFEPFSFYIVDSFGNMKSNDLVKYFSLINDNLSNSITVGFHSHNNLQLAFPNAQIFTKLGIEKEIIVDSSIYGMGRGAGNLNTELFMQFSNEVYKTKYKLDPILSIIDKILNVFYCENGWGYSLPNYLSATYNAHPNYASYLSEKNTLSIDNINEIFKVMDNDKKNSFDKEYIHNLYLKYMERNNDVSNNIEIFKEKIKNKKILLIASGKSSITESKMIKEFYNKNKPIVISLNHDYSCISTDYIFVSNIRRFSELSKSKYNKCITTSNILEKNVFLKCSYDKLINNYDNVSDNSGLMAIYFFIGLGFNEIYLAGFDGYSYDTLNNYREADMALAVSNDTMDLLNEGMSKVLYEYSKLIKLNFITKPYYLEVYNEKNINIW